MLTALHRKLARDLRRLTGQVLTIALVFACGIASFVAMRGNFASLEQARARFYADQRFAHVFAQLERAPDGVAAELERVSRLRWSDVPDGAKAARGGRVAFVAHDPTAARPIETAPWTNDVR